MGIIWNLSQEKTKSEQTNGKNTGHLQRLCHVTRSESTMSMPTMGRSPIMTHGSSCAMGEWGA